MIAFYSTVFQGLQQKERSGFLTTLWDVDNFKGEWEFLAKIYSYVRNEVMKDMPGARTSMRDFLDVACPVMNIVGATDYLQTFNWQLIPNGEDKYELKQYALPLVQKATPMMTGFDLLCHCLANGYKVHNGQNILFRMVGKPENIMTTASFATIPAPDLDAADSSFKNDFLSMISQNPLFAASMIVQDTVQHSPEVHGVNVLRVRDINQIPDDMLRNRGSSTHYRHGDLSHLVNQYSDASDAEGFTFGDDIMNTNPVDDSTNDAAVANTTSLAFEVVTALGPDFMQCK